ncbi:HigA family addiction module antitoxin [Endothiovibrio diazotrophicus]
MTDQASPFRPDWVSPPGDTILDLLEEREWSQAELADRLGFSPKHVNQLIKGKAAITEDAALRLEGVLGSTAGFWLNREAKYREHLARLEAAQRYAGWVDWLDRLPVKELMKAGTIAKRRYDAKAKPALVEELLGFFGVASPEAWEARYAGMEVAFRRTREEQSDVGAITAWLRMGEARAERSDGPKFDRSRFVDALTEIRTLTVQRPEHFEPRLRALCFASGVAFVLVPAIPRAHVSGVARWLNPHRPLIQLSLYGKTNDRFWFTFFHEAAHILLHGKEKRSVYLDDLSASGIDSDEERQANAWARDFLIPPEQAKRLPSIQTRPALTAFAKELGIHPGIVVGRLQYDGLMGYRTAMNDLKISFRFME